MMTRRKREMLTLLLQKRQSAFFITLYVFFFVDQATKRYRVVVEVQDLAKRSSYTKLDTSQSSRAKILSRVKKSIKRLQK